MQSHVLAALVFERYVWYFGSLHPAFEMSCDTEYLEKNSFWFFRKRGLRRFVLCASVLMNFVQTVWKILGDFADSKTQNFQKDVEYVPKLTFWGLLCFFFGCNWRKLFWELPQISLRGTIRVFCSNAESRFGRASFRRLRLVLLVFTSCVWDACDIEYLWKKLLFLEENRNFQNDVEYVPKLPFWGLLCFFFGCNWRKLFWELPQISLRGTIRVFCSNAESRFGRASFRRLRSVLWLFTSCVWDVLRFRLLKKTAFDFFRNVVSVVLYCVQLFWWFSYKPSEK